MFYLKRHFTFAGGHRLSKHKGLCKNFHGHNYDVWITIRSHDVDENDMVMDFITLKEHVNKIIDDLDHSLLVNECDLTSLKSFVDDGMRIDTLGDVDPTAERIAQHIYVTLNNKFVELYTGTITVYEVEVFENVKSSAIYRH